MGHPNADFRQVERAVTAYRRSTRRSARLWAAPGRRRRFRAPPSQAGEIERCGDTETQAASRLAKLAKALQAVGLGMADVM